MTKLKNSNCGKTQNSKYDKTQNVTKLKKSKCDKNQKLKIGQKSKNLNVIKLSNKNLKFDNTIHVREKKNLKTNIVILKKM